MATTTDAAFDQLLARIEQREAAARRRTVLLSIVPIAIAGVVLGGMTVGVRRLAHQADTLETEAQALRTEAAQQQEKIRNLESQVTTLEKQLRETTDLARFRHAIDLTDLKSIASQYPGPARALEFIFTLRERNVPWRLGGRSPEEGFDSPSFAAYVLRQLTPRLVPSLATTNDLVAASRTLMNALPRVDTPGVGDLVFYPTGYALFRFADRRGQPFVIGMTPQGIVALEPNFSQPVGAAQIRW